VTRTGRVRDGETLTRVTHELASSLGVTATLLPMTDDTFRTKVRTADGWLDFQDYFVRRRHRDDVEEIRFDGAETARATPEVLRAIGSADLIVVAPSNPFVSVAPILALNGVADAVQDARARTIAISPLIGGDALRGPAAQMMRSLGAEPSAAGIAGYYSSRYPGLIDVLVIDQSDSAEAEAVAVSGIQPALAGIVIADEAQRRRLAQFVLEI
jgi:LPPG:FO 2-phospho-L-lactate transferase